MHPAQSGKKAVISFKIVTTRQQKIACIGTCPFFNKFIVFGKCQEWILGRRFQRIIKVFGKLSLKHFNQSSKVGVSGHKGGDGSGGRGGRDFGCNDGTHWCM
eukprot:3463158-Karenia_brevis.AAC.1